MTELAMAVYSIIQVGVLQIPLSLMGAKNDVVGSSVPLPCLPCHYRAYRAITVPTVPLPCKPCNNRASRATWHGLHGSATAFYLCAAISTW